jgi:hypothetical protein
MEGEEEEEAEEEGHGAVSVDDYGWTHWGSYSALMRGQHVQAERVAWASLTGNILDRVESPQWGRSRRESHEQTLREVEGNTIQEEDGAILTHEPDEEEERRGGIALLHW